MALISVEFILPLEMYFRVKTLYGYIIKKTICSQSHCQHCIDLLTTSEDNGELRHSLILEKAYTEGAFILPSKLACDVLESANAHFMTNRDQFSKKPKSLDKFIN